MPDRGHLLKLLLMTPTWGVGVGGILDVTPILRTPIMPLNRFRPQNRLRWLKNTKRYALLAFSVTFQISSPPSFLL